MEKIMCKMCGSDDLTLKGDLIICNSCGSKFSNNENANEALRETVDPALSADLIFDFIVEEKQCSNILSQWLISGAYTPDDILIRDKHIELKKVFLPTYLFNGNYSIDWTASSGYNYEEKYQEWDNYKKEYVTKKRTRTDWQPSSGTVNGSFSELIVANSEISTDIASFVNATITFKGKDGTPFSHFDITDYKLLPYTDDKDKSFNIANKNVNNQIHSKVHNQVPGDTKKDVNWNGKTSHKTCKVYYPVYLGSFVYNDKTYTYIIDGRNEKNIFGDKPIEENRVTDAKKAFQIFDAVAIITPIITFITMCNTLGIGILVGFIGIILTIIAYFGGKEAMNNKTVKPQMRRLAMLKILQDNTLNEFEKKRRMQDCLSDVFSVLITHEELKEFQKNNYIENENGSKNIAYNIVDSKQMGLVLSVLATLCSPIVAFFVFAFISG